MLINLTDIPFNNWTEKEKEAAIEEYGWVEDLLWPTIEIKTSEKRITKLANDYIDECKFMFEMANIPVSQQAYNEAVLVIGDAPYVKKVVTLLNNEGIKCIRSFPEPSD